MGVLFLDEFPEFDRRVIEALRQPLEDGEVSIARSKGSEVFPSRFILVAAMNPCPCGNFSTHKTCTCPPGTLMKYQRKISGPIVDRIDMWVHVPALSHTTLSGEKTGEKSITIRSRVEQARAQQHTRFKDEITLNAHMKPKSLDAHSALEESARKILVSSAEKLGLSPRAYHRMIKIARTIADLDDAPTIGDQHILEAFQYRPQKLFEQ
jgi:magnesium chelatase family protein